MTFGRRFAASSGLNKRVFYKKCTISGCFSICRLLFVFMLLFVRLLFEDFVVDFSEDFQVFNFSINLEFIAIS